MEDNYDTNELSVLESGTENFNWVNKRTFPKQLKKFYTQFPLDSWKDIVLGRKRPLIYDEGLYYQGTVNKILRKDIFKDCDFHGEKNGAIDFNFKQVYKIDYDQLLKKKIRPDFYVYRIERQKFFEILESRKYMMILKNENNIPKNIKFISILGEIKSSYESCHTDDDQRYDYEKFIELANTLNTEEYIILMYIYDNSFNFFQKDYFYSAEKKNPIIYGYAPKLYYEDCYKSYNDLIDQLKLNKEKLDLRDKKVFKKKKRELEKENNRLIQENNLLRQQYKKLLNSLIIFISFILVLIISYLLYKFKNN